MSRNPLRAACVAVLLLGGCSLFGSSGSGGDAAAPEAPVAPVRYEPVESVTDLEIGRTRTGYMVMATGLAPAAGYSKPELRPRRQGRPGPDGFLDYDFMARAPDPSLNLGRGSLAARTLRASVELNARDLRNVRGVRVHALSGGLELPF